MGVGHRVRGFLPAKVVERRMYIRVHVLTEADPFTDIPE